MIAVYAYFIGIIIIYAINLFVAFKWPGKDLKLFEESHNNHIPFDVFPLFFIILFWPVAASGYIFYGLYWLVAHGDEGIREKLNQMGERDLGHISHQILIDRVKELESQLEKKR